MTTIDSLYFFEEEGIHEVVNGVGKGAHCDYVVMQYTGLKDLNGDDVYEGDLLHHLDPCSWSPVEVTFINGAFKAKLTKQLLVNLSLEYIRENEFVIVGNIYKNPELLEAP